METLYLVEPGISLKLEITPEVKELYLKEKTEELTVVQRMKIITQLSEDPKIRAIQTPWADMVFCMAAEQSPNLLRKWAAEKPGDLLELIEDKITKALNWETLAIKNGADQSGARELMIQILAPFSPATEPNQLPITEQEMKMIQNKLLFLVEK